MLQRAFDFLLTRLVRIRRKEGVSFKRWESVLLSVGIFAGIDHFARFVCAAPLRRPQEIGVRSRLDGRSVRIAFLKRLRLCIVERRRSQKRPDGRIFFLVVIIEPIIGNPCGIQRKAVFSAAQLIYQLIVIEIPHFRIHVALSRRGFRPGKIQVSVRTFFKYVSVIVERSVFGIHGKLAGAIPARKRIARLFWRAQLIGSLGIIDGIGALQRDLDSTVVVRVRKAIGIKPIFDGYARTVRIKLAAVGVVNHADDIVFFLFLVEFRLRLCAGRQACTKQRAARKTDYRFYSSFHLAPRTSIL